MSFSSVFPLKCNFSLFHFGPSIHPSEAHTRKSFKNNNKITIIIIMMIQWQRQKVKNFFHSLFSLELGVIFNLEFSQVRNDVKTTVIEAREKQFEGSREEKKTYWNDFVAFLTFHRISFAQSFCWMNCEQFFSYIFFCFNTGDTPQVAEILRKKSHFISLLSLSLSIPLSCYFILSLLLCLVFLRQRTHFFLYFWGETLLCERREGDTKSREITKQRKRMK